MKDGPRNDPIKTHRDLVSLLERTCEYLDAAGVDRNLLTAYKKLLRYLRHMPDEVVVQILSGDIAAKSKPARESALALTDREIKDLSGERIQELAANPNLSRKDLERIASLRFGVTRGAISSLRGKRALLDKLATLVGHERTLESIGRAASNQPSQFADSPVPSSQFSQSNSGTNSGDT